MRLYLAPEFEKTIASRGGLSFEDAWDRWSGEVVDENNLRNVERIEFGRTTAYLKRFHGIQTKNHWKLRLQKPHSRSQSERENAIIHALHSEGFGPPRVLAWGHELNRNREVRSLIVTAAHPGTALSDLPPEDRNRLLPEVADELGRTVASGIFLPDLGLDHVYTLADGSLGLLDFHNARRSSRPRRRELARALVRFFRSPGAEDCQAAREEFAQLYLTAAERLDASKWCQRLFATRLPAHRPHSATEEAPELD